MFVKSYFLLGMTLIGINLTIGDYSPVIEHNNLESIRINDISSNRLILSNLNLTAVAKNAFANFSHLKTLDLSGNSLKTLPVLENLTKLETLNLANNDIRAGNFYAYLGSLKTLILSNNSLAYCEPGHFFGLSKYTNIFTRGLHLSWITAEMFEDPVTVGSSRPLVTKEPKKITPEDDDPKLLSRENSTEIKVCIRDGTLMSVEKLENVTSLPEECRKINMTSQTLYLNEMGIETFGHGWYRLHNCNLTSIVLSDNNIAQFTKELLNDLPPEITKMYLSRNKIEKLEKGIIKNKNNMDVLDLRDNFITNIEDGALQHLNLTNWLLLDDNSLKNTKFLDSLPRYIQRVSLQRNKITEISIGNFHKFTRFNRLSLANNDIKEIKANQLRSFSSLTYFSLRMNVLHNIEPKAFQDLTNLVYLDLTDNSIVSPERNIFFGLKKIKQINFESNGIKENLQDLLAVMPSSLEVLSLGLNKIKYRSFKRFQINPLSVMIGYSWKKNVSKQKKSKFSIPNLRILDLHGNSLANIRGGLFEELKNLVYLSLAENNITKIKKGFARNLGNLHVLDISRNPIKNLTNGALFGLRKDSQTVIHVNNVPLELIQGGLFDYV